MGIATQGGGAVSKGPRNKKLSSPSKKIQVMMKKGGEVKKRKSSGDSDLIPQHKRLAMGEKVKGYQYGGAIGRQAAAMGPALNRRANQGLNRNQAVLRARHAANPGPKPPMPSAAARAGATRLKSTPRPVGMKKGGKPKNRKKGGSVCG